MGCQERISLSRVVGTYEGTNGTVRELIQLTSDGHFRHELSFAGKSVLAETGTFTVKPDGTLTVEPFTEYFDCLKGVFTDSGKQFATYSIFFLDAPPFDMIKHWPQRDYFLRKKDLPKTK
jgi:hypothetical protein